MGELTAKRLDGKLTPGRYHDGGGLFLNVTKTGTRSWFIRYQRDNKRTDLGLGRWPDTGLALAREKAREVREQLAQGLDPKAERDRDKAVPTFREAAKVVFDASKGEWRNPKHVAQWWTTLETYAFPVLGDRKVSEIDTDHVLDVLEPIWTEKPETARRVRQRIFAVLDWATGKRHRQHPIHVAGVNKALPKVDRKVRHQPAMDYADIADFLPKLRERVTMARLALEIVVLCAVRSGEVRLAEWAEIDFDEKLWRIPAKHTKANKPHVVPLSDQAVAVFEQAKALRYQGQPHVFAGAKRGRPLSDMALLKVMRDMDLEAVPHGFRSSFRDWVAEETDYPGDVAEAALAHRIRDKTEAAYRRGKLLNKRAAMMQDWADYCEAGGE